MQNKKRMIYIAIFNLFLVFVGVGLVVPIMPDLRNQMGYSGTTMGMMISIFAIAQLIASPITGFLSDKMGRKKIIAVGMLIFAVSELIFGLAQSLPLFYFSRALGGVSAAMIMPSVTAYVADLTNLLERPKAMGYVSAAISGGFIIGPGLGGLVASGNIRNPFFAAAILGLFAFFITLFGLKESHPLKSVQEEVEQRTSVYNVLKEPFFISLFVIILISSFGLQSFESIYSVMANANFGFNTQAIALIITVSGIFALIVQIFYFDRIVQKIGEIRLIQYSFFLSAIFIALIAITRSNIVVLISTFIVFLAFDLFRPAVTTYLSKNAGDQQGTINGLNSTFTSFGNILGPLAAGALFDVNHFFPYFVSALILLVTGFLSLRMKKLKSNH